MQTVVESLVYNLWAALFTQEQTVVESLLYNLWAAIFTKEQTVVESLLYNLMAALLIDSISITISVSRYNTNMAASQ